MSKKSCNFAAEIENDDDNDDDDDDDNDDDDDDENDNENENDNDNDNDNIIEMKKSILLLLAMVVSMGMMAVPARRMWHEKTQPDGTTIKVMMVGDEFYHYYINESGERIAQGEDGWWQVISDGAISDKAISEEARGEGARRVASRPMKAIGNPTKVQKGLVILVQFPDKKFAAKNTRQEMDSMLNAKNYTYEGSIGSAREYFRAQSNGAYVPSFDVVGPVTVSQEADYYGQNTSGDGTDKYPGQMVMEACVAVDAEVDFTQFDADNDGQIDLVYIIYAGQGENEVYTPELLWPMRWVVQTNNCPSTWRSKKVDGKTIHDFAYSNEIDWNNKRAGIGTFCHEFSHVLGLPDYYDTQYSTNSIQGYTPGSWDVMDLGNQNGDGKIPCNYSPWEKYFFGWATPKCLKDTGDVTLTTDYDDFYQLNSAGTLANWNSTATQYYIENRQKNGWDKGLPHHGMIVWKVEYDGSAWNYNIPNNTANKPRYTIVSATDAPHVYPYRKDSEGYMLWSEGDRTPFPGFNRVTSVTLLAEKPILDIQEWDGEIYFSYIEKRSFYTYVIASDHATVSSEEGEVLNGATFTVTIEPEEGYVITEDELDVEMGGETLVMGVDYTYADNVLTIPNVSNDIEIIVDPVPATPSAIQQAQKGVRARKILVGGELYIVVDGVRMDAMGRR